MEDLIKMGLVEYVHDVVMKGGVPTDDELLAIVAGGAPVSFEEIKRHPLGLFFDQGSQIALPADPATAAIVASMVRRLSEIDPRDIVILPARCSPKLYSGWSRTVRVFARSRQPRLVSSPSARFRSAVPNPSRNCSETGNSSARA